MKMPQILSQLFPAAKQTPSDTAKTPASSVYDSLDESQVKFAPWGKSSSFMIEGERKLEHGTSNALMKKATALLQRDFELNHKKDMVRYFCKSKYTYYAVIQSIHHANTVDCAVRVVLDDLEHPKIVLLDFIRTRAKHKGQGLATKLVKFILEGSAALGANVYVTSTKEAKPYWSRFGFVKESNKDVDYALNEFRDCTLLSLPTNTSLDFSEYDDSEYESDSSEDSSDSSEESDSEDSSDSSDSSDPSSSDTSFDDSDDSY